MYFIGSCDQVGGRRKRVCEREGERGSAKEKEKDREKERKRERERACWVSPAQLFTYGVATVSRIDKIIGLFCRIASLL